KHDKAYVEIKLKGPQNNINAIGAKVVLFTNSQLYLYEKRPVHGFLSTMEIPMHIGLDKIKTDSAFLIWPDNTCQAIQLPANNTHLSFTWQKGLPLFDYHKITDHKRNTS